MIPVTIIGAILWLIVVFFSRNEVVRIFGIMGLVVCTVGATIELLGDTPKLTPVDITVYHAVAEQTDSTPLITADGSEIDPQNLQPWVAVSRDMLADYPLNKANPPKIVIRCKCPYDGEIREVRDVKNVRYKTSIDLLVDPSKGGRWEGVIYKP